jgi:integrase
MASIHERHLRNGRTAWELTHGRGQTRIRMVVGHSKEEGEAALREFNEQLELQGPPVRESIRAAVAEYERYLQSNRRPRTVSRYRRLLRTFVDSYLSVHHPGVTLLREVRPPHFEDYKRQRAAGKIVDLPREEERRREDVLRRRLAKEKFRKRPGARGKYGWLGRHPMRPKVTARTINFELRTLTTFSRWARRQNLIFVNPASAVEKLRVPSRALPRFLTSEQLKRVFASCGERERRVYQTFFLSGMRRGEREHLTWDDVSFELGVIQIREKEGWRPKTDERVIPISPLLQQILRAQNADRASAKWVFPNEAGNIDTHILERLKAACARAGTPASTVHALRHSFGAHLRMAGVSWADIGDLLGHRSLATTQIYAAVPQEHLRNAVERLTPILSEESLGRR